MSVSRIPVFFPQQGHRLYGTMHLPDPISEDALGLLICAPFADEAVHAHRMLVDWSARLAAEGIAAFLFDYTGTGDSEGEFDDGSLTRYVEDIVAASAYFKRAAGVARCGVVGLRLGANLAVRAAGADPTLSPVILWAPIRSPARYFRAFLRLRLFTEVTTSGRPTTTVRDLEEWLTAGECVDVLGYSIPPAMARDFLALDGDSTPPASRPALVIEAPSEAAGPDVEEPGFPRVTRRQVALEPAWERARLGCHDELFRVTLEWVRAVTAMREPCSTSNP